jgi:hypothetical protein
LKQRKKKAGVDSAAAQAPAVAPLRAVRPLALPRVVRAAPCACVPMEIAHVPAVVRAAIVRVRLVRVPVVRALRVRVDPAALAVPAVRALSPRLIPMI